MRGGAAASAAVVKRLAVLSWHCSAAESVPRRPPRNPRTGIAVPCAAWDPAVPDTLSLHPPFVAHRTARFSLTLYGTDMTEPITPKPGTPGAGRGSSATNALARPAGQSPSDSSGHRDTVLLSDVPDAATVVTEDAASSAATSPSLSPAAIAALGVRYEILGEAGHGSMGNVYKARDRETGETVALKLLKPEIASDQAMMDRFKNE